MSTKTGLFIVFAFRSLCARYKCTYSYCVKKLFDTKVKVRYSC